MRIAETLCVVGLAALIGAGCAGPEKKLGRGIQNLVEFGRLGELRRSVEQTALYEGPEAAYTTGMIRGFNRSLARTLSGAVDVATFPIPLPSYDHNMFYSKMPVYPDPNLRNRSYPFGGMVLGDSPVYPDSYRPGLVADSTFFTDTSLGFSGGDVVPHIPGSRFRIFDN
jgi:putative exosortase-associated protein (TIGR04073 family)